MKEILRLNAWGKSHHQLIEERKLLERDELVEFWEHYCTTLVIK